MPKSKFLLLVIGSNHKQKGGDGAYRRDQSILAHVPDASGNQLLRGRARILRWIFRGGVTRHGIRIDEMPSNVALVEGPEFGGTSSRGEYLPAAVRFRGRWFATLEPNAVELLTNSPHHVLILTGLYGLVTPTEMVQDHQCHVDDHPNLHRCWTQGDLLTDVLVAYIKQNDITHVIEMTAQSSYRALIAWERVRDQAKVVLHCFGTQSVGDELLMPLGVLARELLSNASKGRMPIVAPGTYFETPFERVNLSESPQPPRGAPQELERQRAQINVADELGRMRRCFIRMMDAMSSSAFPQSADGVVERIKHLAGTGALPSKVAQGMLEITRTRNRIEYGHQQSVTAPALKSLRTHYAAVKQWAQSARLDVPTECLEV